MSRNPAEAARALLEEMRDTVNVRQLGGYSREFICERIYQWIGTLSALLPLLTEQAEAQRTLDSLAVMLGWVNTPPQHVFEAEIRAMKARIREQDEALKALEQERDKLKRHVALDESRVKANKSTTLARVRIN